MVQNIDKMETVPASNKKLRRKWMGKCARSRVEVSKAIRNVPFYNDYRNGRLLARRLKRVVRMRCPTLTRSFVGSRDVRVRPRNPKSQRTEAGRFASVKRPLGPIYPICVIRRRLSGIVVKLKPSGRRKTCGRSGILDLWLVSVAKKYVNRGLHLLDLIQKKVTSMP